MHANPGRMTITNILSVRKNYGAPPGYLNYSSLPLMVEQSDKSRRAGYSGFSLPLWPENSLMDADAR